MAVTVGECVEPYVAPRLRAEGVRLILDELRGALAHRGQQMRGFFRMVEDDLAEAERRHQERAERPFSVETNAAGVKARRRNAARHVARDAVRESDVLGRRAMTQHEAGHHRRAAKNREVPYRSVEPCHAPNMAQRKAAREGASKETLWRNCGDARGCFGSGERLGGARILCKCARGESWFCERAINRVRMRWFGVRLQLLLAALMVLLVAAACERSLYFCKMMDRAVAECCCARAHDGHPNEGANVRAPDCCELIAVSKQGVVASHEVAPAQLSRAALIATLPAFEYPAPSFRLVERPPSLARAPPAIGPPLFISHCSLLI